MRAAYFNGFLRDLLLRRGEPRIAAIGTFADVGYEKPTGLVIEYADRSRFFLQSISSGSGDFPLDAFVPKDEPPAVTPSGAPLTVAELEDLVVSVLESASEPTIADVTRMDRRHGVSVRFTTGLEAYVYWLGPARAAGTQPEGPLYEHKR